MSEKGCKPNEFIYSVHINGLFREGNVKEAIKLWKVMIDQRCKSNVVLYITLIDGLYGEGKLKQRSF